MRQHQETIEQIVMILVILAFIPWVLMGCERGLYQTLIFWIGGIITVAIFVIRVRRYREAVREAEEMAQHRGQGPLDSRNKLQ